MRWRERGRECKRENSRESGGEMEGEREIMIMPEKGGMKGERKCENEREREK